MSAGTAIASFEEIERRIVAEPEPSRRVEVLLVSLADVIKSTSNDQNVQRLSRELRAAAAPLAQAAVSTG